MDGENSINNSRAIVGRCLGMQDGWRISQTIKYFYF
jgi:hypothetical protein